MRKILFALALMTALTNVDAQVLYGTTSEGGANNGGTIAKLNIDANTLTEALSSDCTDGRAPVYSKLLQASDGKLYGITTWGGKDDHGIIFSYDPSTATNIKLKDFNEPIDGGLPYGSLVQASDGKLYGMTSVGGSNALGVIFSYNPVTSVYTKLEDFDGSNGAKPFGNLIQASDGKLYGMTSEGGSLDSGVIFSYDPSTAVFTKLKDFNDIDGGLPYGSLFQASDGKLYAMTQRGGSNSVGVIFFYDPVTLAYTKLLDFDYSETGAFPIGNDFIEVSDGKLYGMTTRGGINGKGVIFSYDLLTSTYTTLKDFMNDTNGIRPCGSLVQASNGKLYGMTCEGGSDVYDSTFAASGFGAIFSYDPVTGEYIKLRDFDKINGAHPYGSLMQDANGKLYGVTTDGGKGDGGVIFSYDPPSATLINLYNFGINKTSTYYQDADGDGYGDAADSVQLCNPKEGYVTNNKDCDDRNSTIYPGAPEIRDGKDNNCNGLVDENCNVPVTISIGDASITEGNKGLTQMKFMVSLNAPATSKVTVNYKTVNGTAIAPSDYGSTSGTISFKKGVTKQMIKVSILGDKLVEPNETFTVFLSNPVNAIIDNGVATGTILNDDKAGHTPTPCSITQSKALQNKNYTVKVWPNPAKNFVKVQLDGIADGDVTLQLQDIQGKVLKHQKIKSFAKITTQQMNVSGLANGMYLLVIIGENGSMHTEKIIIQK